MKISKRGIDLIKRYEGIKLTAYLCPAKVWTIGYGSTGDHVREGMTITEEEAESLLLRDLARFERGVLALAPRCTQGQFDALVSFAFNVGLGALRNSTLLRLHNQNQHKLASQQFARWNRAGGQVLRGLTRRRDDERLLYVS